MKVPNFDIKSVEKEVWFVETIRNIWVDGDGESHSDFDMFEDAISGGFISTVFFFIRSATVKKKN